MIRRLFAALLAACLLASPAAAWWEQGHEAVARIAMLEASPATRAEIRRLLAQSALLRTPTCPTRTLEQASVWADCIKPLGDRFSYAYNWHYQNVDVCQPFDLNANCPDGNCVSAQIARATRMLADRSLPTRDRVEALAFLTHFVGDLAMPMHAGDRHDRGGNDTKADYGMIAGRTNLHSIWDGLLAERAIYTPVAGAAGMLGDVPADERAALAAGSVEDWSRDSWEVAKAAYATLLGGDGCGPPPTGRVKMTDAMVTRQVPVLRRQIAKGGLRLARLLDEALGGVTPGLGSPLLEKRRG